MSWSGCTVTSNTDTTSTSGVGGSGNSSNVGGEGATGGIGVGAAGGTGGTGTGGTGGTGGGPTCVGETGPDDWTGVDCNNAGLMPIAGGAHLCGTTGMEEPPGIVVCVQAFKAYTEGSAENMFNCLKLIGTQVAQACDDGAVQACSDKVANEACDVAEVQTACKDLVMQCTAAGDTSLTEANCNLLLRLLNATALASVETCEGNATEGDCKTTLDTCWEQVVSQ